MYFPSTHLSFLRNVFTNRLECIATLLELISKFVGIWLIWNMYKMCKYKVFTPVKVVYGLLILLVELIDG